MMMINERTNNEEEGKKGRRGWRGKEEEILLGPIKMTRLQRYIPANGTISILTRLDMKQIRWQALRRCR